MKLKVDGMGEAIERINESLNRMFSLLIMAIVGLALALVVR